MPGRESRSRCCAPIWSIKLAPRSATAPSSSSPVLSLMYLNNNLHALHHLEPAAPWHERPQRFRQRRNEVFVWNGGYRYRGYGEFVVRHFLHPKEPLVHPLPEL